MFWGPDDWDALMIDRSVMTRPCSTTIDAMQHTLAKIPRSHRKTVADLGCGCGDLLPFLSGHFENVVAIDYAPAILSRARDRHWAENIIFRRRDIRDLTPFRNTFDVAVALDSILGPRSDDIDRILKQINLGMHEGGLFLATFPAAPRDGKPVDMTLTSGGSIDLPPLFHEIDLQYRLGKAGFQGIRIRRMERRGTGRPALICIAAKRALN